MEKLLEYLNAERGRRIALADALKIKPSAISQWDVVPLNRVVAIEGATGVPRHELRPDVFGPPLTVEAFDQMMEGLAAERRSSSETAA